MEEAEKKKKEADLEKAYEEFNAAFDKEIALHDFPILEPSFVDEDYYRIENTKVN